MTVFVLTGDGEFFLSEGTTALNVQVTVHGLQISNGRAKPANLYGVGLYRLGSSGWFAPAHPFDATFQRIEIPASVTSFAYSVFGGNEVTVTELVAPGPIVGTEAVIGPPYVPSLVFTNPSPGCFGQQFQAFFDEPLLIAVYYFQPDEGIIPLTQNLTIWNSDTQAEIATYSIVGVTRGWNQLDIAPLTLDNGQVYMISYPSATGATRVAEPKSWERSGSPHLKSQGGFFADSADNVFPTGGPLGDWLGPDVLVRET